VLYRLDLSNEAIRVAAVALDDLALDPRLSRSLLGTVLLLSSIGIAAPAGAQMMVSPSGGISGEGQPALGAAIGMSVGAVRPELELGWARRGIDRRAATPSEPHRNVPGPGGLDYLPAVMADVSTLIFRVAVPLRQGTTFEPFGSVGAGSCPSHTSTTARGVVAASRHAGRLRSGRRRDDLADQQNRSPHRGDVPQSPRAGWQFSRRPGQRPRLHERAA